MILPNTSTFVLILMVLSMLCFGGWASFFKAGGKWRYELFYFDFAFGLLIAVVIYSFTFGSLGYDGFSFADDLQQAGKHQWLYAFMAGLIFNFGNMLLLGAVSVAGMTVAFPMAMGVGLLVGSLVGFVAHPSGNPMMTALGCALILTSVVVNAISARIKGVQEHEKLARSGLAKSTRRPNPLKVIVLCTVSGILLGFYGPLLARARETEAGLGPYALGALFALGVFISTFVYNIFLMNLPVQDEPLDFSAYFAGGMGKHLLGLIAGIVWYSGVVAAWVGISTPEQLLPGVFTRFMLAQGAPVVAALLGLVIWREFRAGDMRTKILALLMLALFICGLAMIGLAPMYLRKV